MGPNYDPFYLRNLNNQNPPLPFTDPPEFDFGVELGGEDGFGPGELLGMSLVGIGFGAGVFGSGRLGSGSLTTGLGVEIGVGLIESSIPSILLVVGSFVIGMGSGCASPGANPSFRLSIVFTSPRTGVGLVPSVGEGTGFLLITSVSIFLSVGVEATGSFITGSLTGSRFKNALSYIHPFISLEETPLSKHRCRARSLFR